MSHAVQARETLFRAELPEEHLDMRSRYIDPTEPLERAASFENISFPYSGRVHRGAQRPLEVIDRAPPRAMTCADDRELEFS